MSCNNLTYTKGTRRVVPEMSTRVTCPLPGRRCMTLKWHLRAILPPLVEVVTDPAASLSKLYVALLWYWTIKTSRARIPATSVLDCCHHHTCSSCCFDNCSDCLWTAVAGGSVRQGAAKACCLRGSCNRYESVGSPFPSQRQIHHPFDRYHCRYRRCPLEKRRGKKTTLDKFCRNYEHHFRWRHFTLF